MKKDKYIVGCKNDLFGTGYEYFNIDVANNHLIGHHNPNFAAKFGSQKEAKQFLKKYITFENTETLPLDKEIEKFDIWIKNGCIYRTLAIKNNKLSRKYNNESAEEVLDWWVECTKYDDSVVSYQDYETWPDLYKVFNNIWSIDEYDDGLISFQLYIAENSTFKTFKKEFNLVSPYCTPEKNGNKIYSIIDRFLGEYGDRATLIEHKNGTFSVRDRYETIINGNLKDCFDYLKKYLYHE